MNRAATFALALLTLCSLASAKDLKGVFEDALQNDPTIRQANANRLAAREARPQAWSAILPQLNGQAGINWDHNSGYQDQVTALTNPANPNGPPIYQVLPLPQTIDATNKNWALSLRSSLISWTNWMNIKAASKEVAQAEAIYQAAEQNLILRTAQAYFAVLAADDTLAANQASLEAFNRQLDQANKRFEVGLIAITDVEDAKSARDSAAAAVIAAKRALATTQYQLAEITGQEYDKLSKPGTDMPLKGPEPENEDRWVDISLEQNPNLISSRLAADIARDNVRAAIGGHLPTIDLVAGRSYTQQNSDQTIEFLPFNDVNSKFNDRQIGLQVTVPIFSGGYTQSKVRQNEYLWIAAKEGVVQSSRTTERQARDAYLGVISGIARVQALQQSVESSRTALKATSAGYEVGTRTSVDVVNAQKTLVQAETDFAAARYDYLVSVLQLRFAAGILDRAQLLQINTWLTQTTPTSPGLVTPESVLPTAPAPQAAPAPGTAAPAPATAPPSTPPGGGRR